VSVGILVLAVVWDLVLGELPERMHPVVWIGRSVRVLERMAPMEGRLRPLVAGVVIALVVPVVFGGASALLMAVAGRCRGIDLAVGGVLLTSTFAIRGLRDAALAVRERLEDGDLSGAQHALRALCSRDPRGLDEHAIVGATVASVAENASDSIVAPLLYYVLLGVPGAVAYRAVNTLDAMIGYHGQYEWLGKPAARLDDLANLAPSRLTAALLLFGGWLAGEDVRKGWFVLRRDRRRTASPNAGVSMAAMAGLLGVVIEKVGHYRLGDGGTRPTCALITRAWRVVAHTAAAAVVLAAWASLR
jgi:adenosylcobinamide-phosphate synthase